MTSSSPPDIPFNLDDMDKEILAGLSLQDDAFCCCSLLDTNLHLDEHLDDCELHLIRSNVDVTMSDNRSDTSTSTENSKPRSDAQRRKHRECVARIRHKLRKSIAALQAEQTHLEKVLRRTVASASSVAPAHTDPRMRATRLAHVELVREQIRLEDERSELEVVQERREQYTRLVQRELEKARTFAAYKN